MPINALTLEYLGFELSSKTMLFTPIMAKVDVILETLHYYLSIISSQVLFQVSIMSTYYRAHVRDL